MPTLGAQERYFSRFAAIVRQSLQRLVRRPSHSHRDDARRIMARRWFLLTLLASVTIVVSMLLLDVPAIQSMPMRGSAALWPVRIFTDFAKTEYVLAVALIAIVIVALLLPKLSAASRPSAALLGIWLQYLFFSVLVARVIGDVLKFLFGRGRPFVGGDANATNFAPFARTEAFYSFPSGHALTAFAMAFAISSIWPRLSTTMWTFAVLICVSRVVLLAHHPSDVVAGALVGVVGAMFVRYWFAVRRLGFAIKNDGSIVPLHGPSWGAFKRVARGAFAP